MVKVILWLLEKSPVKLASIKYLDNLPLKGDQSGHAWRDIEWEKKFQIAPHYVYLANSSGVKVGITRKSQGIKRWMDQGATQAILFAEVPNRRYSGDIELALKKIWEQLWKSLTKKN